MEKLWGRSDVRIIISKSKSIYRFCRSIIKYQIFQKIGRNIILFRFSFDSWIYNFHYIIRIFEYENERRRKKGRVYLDATRREMCPRIYWREGDEGEEGFEKQRNRVVFVQIRLIGKYLHEKGGAQACESLGWNEIRNIEKARSFPIIIIITRIFRYLQKCNQMQTRDDRWKN